MAGPVGRRDYPGVMRGFWRTLTIILALLGSLAVGVLGAAYALQKLPFQTETIDRSGPALLRSVQDISQFHAAVGTFEVLLDIEEDVRWVPGFIAGERSLFVAAGTVNAYVDFSDLGEGDLELSEDGTSVTIDLPEAQLDEPNLDQERTYLYSHERGIVNRVGDAISPQDQQSFYTESEARIAAAAAGSELVSQAETNTRAMLVGMFEALDLQVTFG